MSNIKVVLAKFEPGNITATKGLMNKVGADYAYTCLEMHLLGDWGSLCEEDAKANDYAMRHGGRLMSVYPLPDHPGDFWIITEADRSVTTFLLPEEY